MRTIDAWSRLNWIERKIAEELPERGEITEKWQRRHNLFQCELERRMDQRDAWRIPAERWLELERLGRELDTWNAKKIAEERAAATSQKHLSQISRQWQEMTDLARGRKPQPNGIVSPTTIVVDWGSRNTGTTTA